MFVGGVVCLLAALVMRGEEGCRVCGGEDGDGTAVDGWIGLFIFRVLKQRHEKGVKMKIDHQFHFFIIFDDVVEYLSIRCTQLKKQRRRTKPILTVG
jgi:hypothetical protein